MSGEATDSRDAPDVPSARQRPFYAPGYCTCAVQANPSSLHVNRFPYRASVQLPIIDESIFRELALRRPGELCSPLLLLVEAVHLWASVIEVIWAPFICLNLCKCQCSLQQYKFHVQIGKILIITVLCTRRPGGGSR